MRYMAFVATVESGDSKPHDHVNLRYRPYGYWEEEITPNFLHDVERLAQRIMDENIHHLNKGWLMLIPVYGPSALDGAMGAIRNTHFFWFERKASYTLQRYAAR